MLALLYIGSGRATEAEAPLKAVAAAFPDGPERFTLADYYVTSNRYAEAKTLLEEIAKSPKAEFVTAAKLRLAGLGFAQGDLATTLRMVDDVLGRDPHQAEALIAKARLQEAQGKRDEAMATIRLAVSTNPTSVPAHYVLGKFLTDRLQFEEAMTEQKEALKMNPEFARADLELARLSLNMGQFQQAVTFAQDATRLMPGLAETHLLLARAHIANGHPEAAEAPMRILLESFPKDPIIQTELGRLQLAKNDVAGARASFDRALAANPADATAIQGLNTIDLRQKNAQAARQRVEKALHDHPNDSALQLLAGRTYLAAGDVAAAEKMLKQAVSGGLTDFEALSYLASIYVQQKRLPEAIGEYQRMVALQPRSVPFLTMIGILLQLEGKLDEAKTQYEKVLTIDPKAAAAANNLAGIYGDRNENLDVALQLAQVAKAGMPNSHEVSDTLGWISYKKKMGPQAVTALKAAVNAQPDNAVYLYHLGAAYALINDKAAARESLQKALSKGAFDGADDARKILDSLK
jgi:tetratricopeptide (TPR) repeat protein